MEPLKFHRLLSFIKTELCFEYLEEFGIGNIAPEDNIQFCGGLITSNNKLFILDLNFSTSNSYFKIHIELYSIKCVILLLSFIEKGGEIF
jgi:hypothetical protein